MSNDFCTRAQRDLAAGFTVARVTLEEPPRFDLAVLAHYATVLDFHTQSGSCYTFLRERGSEAFLPCAATMHKMGMGEVTKIPRVRLELSALGDRLRVFDARDLKGECLMVQTSRVTRVHPTY